MSAVITHRSGDMERDPSADALAALVGELDEAEGEHSDICLTGEGGWTLIAHTNGLLVWENIDRDGAVRHQLGVGRATVLALFRKLSAGDIAAVESQHWSRGH